MNRSVAYKTGLTFSLLLSLLPVGTACARWSALLQVKPGMTEEPPINVKYANSPDSKTCNLTIDTAVPGEMYAWLVHADRELSPKEQEMRYFFWDTYKNLVPPQPRQVTYPANAPFQSIIQQVPESLYKKTVDQDAWAKEHHLPAYEESHAVYTLALSKATAKNSYLYIDYSRTIFDGGWFYSIDLGAFCAQLDQAH